LFNVFLYDNGPDYPSDGLFRIVKDSKIGYANLDGQIIIEPQFKCAQPFTDGKAEVTFECEMTMMDEHSVWESDQWFTIDKTGKKIE